MKYFIDTEFIEGFHKPLFGKRRHFIDLVSIGIVSEDGREYYAISNEFNPDKADNWVKENVLYPIIHENGYRKPLSNLHGVLGYDKSALKRVQNRVGKSNKQIAHEILEFTGCRRDYVSWRVGEDVPEIYAYFADYDWVVFCSLFGRMIDLPKGFPMYCRDLKQTLDERAAMKLPTLTKRQLINPTGSNIDFNVALNSIKVHPDYPKQENRHNALDDARWNMKLFNFLENLK